MNLKKYVFIFQVALFSEAAYATNVTFDCPQGIHTVPVWEERDELVDGVMQHRAQQTMKTIDSALVMVTNGDMQEIKTEQNLPVLGRWLGSFIGRNMPNIYNYNLLDPLNRRPDQAFSMTRTELNDFRPTRNINVTAYLPPADWTLQESQTRIILDNGVRWDLKFSFKQAQGMDSYRMSLYSKDPQSDAWDDDAVLLPQRGNMLISSPESPVILPIPFQRYAGYIPVPFNESAQIRFKNHPGWFAPEQLRLNVTYSTFGQRPFSCVITQDGQAQTQSLTYQAPYITAHYGDDQKENIFEAIGATYIRDEE